MTSVPRGNRAEPATLEALQSGDERAFRDLVSALHSSMVRVASGFVPSRAIAEEVVQDTWVAVIKGLANFEGRSSLKTWIFSILVNQARTRGQREQRSVPFSSVSFSSATEDEGPTVDPDRFQTEGRWVGHWSRRPQHFDVPAGNVEAAETRAVVTSAIATLPPNQQRVVWLRDVEGCSAEEVCGVLDISEGNQRVLLHRARAKVRAALETHLAS